MGTDGGRSHTAVNDYGWGKATTVEDWLFAEGHRFDFFQAVRLLEIIYTTGQMVQRRIVSGCRRPDKAPIRQRRSYIFALL